MLRQQYVEHSCRYGKSDLRQPRFFAVRARANLRPHLNLSTGLPLGPPSMRPTMKKILLLNGGKAFAHSAGRYNATLHETAVAYLDRSGCDVRQTWIDQGYDVAEEVAKFLWADVIIYQMPGWWMGAPWTVKKYIDEVFTAGHGSLYANDGRTRSDASQKYGSGGLIQGKQYMLSLTWNAPRQAFDDPTDFFEAKGVDAVYFPFHKANQFLGMSGLPTFLCVDVMKVPAIEADIRRYEQHLAEVFDLPK
ncbi:putative NADPH-quinone reductase (modulator of drug activity B) [Pseudomonas asplenii]|uniref:NADPH:quinone oxidoreductase MdaB n=2 Tax=Pseudomonas TaxID=286 RepID=A0A0M9GEM2_9PSED|nr:putative NADPH-quinone reductase (modulator of drug activity B) [Pseudomonas fuscovaginae]KPA97259.1 putative NADPH-quinone reductase (modulator of drug activity B) [Pseudomonas fuscovaginae]